MDNFMDKLAQRYNAGEMIKANSEADTAEMQNLQEQVEAYEAVLQEMRKLNYKNTELTEKMYSLVDESIEKVRTLQIEASENGANTELISREMSDAVTGALNEALNNMDSTVARTISESLATALAQPTEEIKQSTAVTANVGNKVDSLKESSEILFTSVEDVKLAVAKVSEESKDISTKIDAILELENNAAGLDIAGAEVSLTPELVEMLKEVNERASKLNEMIALVQASVDQNRSAMQEMSLAQEIDKESIESVAKGVADVKANIEPLAAVIGEAKEAVVVTKEAVVTTNANVLDTKISVEVINTNVAELKDSSSVVAASMAELKDSSSLVAANVAELKDSSSLVAANVAELKDSSSVVAANMADIKDASSLLVASVAESKDAFTAININVSETKEAVNAVSVNASEAKEAINTVYANTAEIKETVSAVCANAAETKEAVNAVNANVTETKEAVSSLNEKTDRIIANLESENNRASFDDEAKNYITNIWNSVEATRNVVNTMNSSSNEPDVNDEIKSMMMDLASDSTEIKTAVRNIRMATDESKTSLKASFDSAIYGLKQDNKEIVEFMQRMNSNITAKQNDPEKERKEEEARQKEEENKKAIEDRFKLNEDFIHKESVKVYRNVQAVINEKSDQQTTGLEAKVKTNTAKIGQVKVIAIIAAALSALTLTAEVLQILGVL